MDMFNLPNPDLPPDFPPPYSPSTPTAGGASPPSSLPPPPTSLDPAFFSSTLRTHLTTLPTKIRATSAHNTSRQIASDLATISLLVPYIEAFLSAAVRKAATPSTASLSTTTCASSSSILQGSLTLVPAPAVPPRARLGDTRERRREGEYVRVVRVEPQGSFFLGPDGDKKGPQATGDRKTAADGSGQGSRLGETIGFPFRPAHADEAAGELRAWDPRRDEYFDSWGRFGDDADAPDHLHAHSDPDDPDDSDYDNCSQAERHERNLMWWTSESNAKRLASYLQPAPIPTSKLERKNIQRTVVETKQQEKKANRWFSFGGAKGKKKDSTAAHGPSRRAEDVVVADEAPGLKEEKVSMTVSAQELSFQQENEFGIYESISGWGIVMDVRIRGS